MELHRCQRVYSRAMFGCLTSRIFFSALLICMYILATIPQSFAFRALMQAQPKRTTASATNSSETIKILAIGDSITAGSKRTGNYRMPLKKMLTDAGKNVEFVGGGCDDCWAKKVAKQGVGKWCGLSCVSAEDKYVGFWMWTAKQVIDGNGSSKSRTDGRRDGLAGWIEKLDFDVATIHLGTNGIETIPTQEHVSYIAEIVRILQRRNPKVKVFLAKIIPFNESSKIIDKRMKEFNDALVKIVNGTQVTVNEQGTLAGLNIDTSHVYIVDCNKGFDPKSMMADGLHPNKLGGEYMAKQYFREIMKVI